jgi:hypothetical protein
VDKSGVHGVVRPDAPSRLKVRHGVEEAQVRKCGLFCSSSPNRERTHTAGEERGQAGDVARRNAAAMGVGRWGLESPEVAVVPQGEEPLPFIYFLF